MGMYEDLKAAWAEVMGDVVRMIEWVNLDQDEFPEDGALKARFLPIIFAKGFGEEAWEPISGYLWHCASVKSAQYWSATPPDHKRGEGFRKRALGVFADAAGMGIAPQPYLELVWDGLTGLRAVGAFCPDGSLLKYR